MSFDQWYNLLIALIPYLFPVIAAVCALGYRKFRGLFPADKMAVVDMVASTAVHQVEQQLKDVEDNAAKRQAAISAASNALRTFGVKNVDEDVLATYVEKAVYALKVAQAQPPFVVPVVTPSSPSTPTV